MKGSNQTKFVLAGIVVTAIVLGQGSLALAGSIDPGFDLFATTSGTYLDLGAPIGRIDLRGDPLGGLGNTDTIIERLSGVVLPDPPSSGTVDAELVALSLVSVEPVTIGGTQFDVKVESGRLLNTQSSPFFRNPLIPSSPLGDATLTASSVITTTVGPAAGLFQYSLPFVSWVTFTETGDPQSSTVITSTLTYVGGGAYTVTLPPCYPQDERFPSGGFYPIGAMTLTASRAAHNATSATPEPSALLLVSAGVLGIVALRRRRKRTG